MNACSTLALLLLLRWFLEYLGINLGIDFVTADGHGCKGLTVHSRLLMIRQRNPIHGFPFGRVHYPRGRPLRSLALPFSSQDVTRLRVDIPTPLLAFTMNLKH